MTWEPGSHRRRREFEEPFEDVPDHLRGPLRMWVRGLLQEPNTLMVTCLAMRLDVEDPRRDSNAYWTTMAVLDGMVEHDPTFLLDLVEVLLRHVAKANDREHLEALLMLGNSIYTIADDAEGLAYRVLPGVKAVVEEVVRTAGTSASAHLAEAWNLAYGRAGDPVKAYSEAVKAVEAAAIPLVQPRHAKATLGTVLGELDGAAKWTFVIGERGGMERIASMGRLLWEGQTSRHGGSGPTRAETVEEARAAVHLAATLVQFFTTGAVIG